MIIRKTTMNDVNDVLKIFETAREFMVRNGNTTQWGNGYPGEDILTQDILNGHSYVCVEDGNVVGTFSFMIGEEPTYLKIEQGEWRSNKLYGTIHRVASSGTAKGITKACFDFCASQIDYLRIDTHADNLSMQSAIKKYGFKECGIIFVRNGAERVAFDYLAN
ncbi:histone acetyltransferase HPA2 and related acetyltransferases [Lachnospiraceae bacterium KM106-2]|nr:histone acetyltransferase HPA2 and related acetyltransferases [Lachnospiraceae bacterium KM106-2]